MRQSQRIALAAQNTARTEMFTQMVNTWTESKFQWGSGIRLYGTDAYDFHPNINLGHLVLYILDNDYLQYNLGLMDEMSGGINLSTLLRSMRFARVV